MPALIRPRRYNPPAADTLRKTFANSKISKMLPNRHDPTRSSVRVHALGRYPGTADIHRPDDNALPSHLDHQAAYYHHYGERQYREDGAEGQEYCSGHAGGRPWEAGSRWHSGYYCEDGWQDRRDSAVEIQPPIAQQGQYYHEGPTDRPVTSAAAGGRQYWTQPSDYSGVHSAAPTWQGFGQEFWQGHRQYDDRAAYYGQRSYYGSACSQTSYAQEQEYVYPDGWNYQLPPQYIYQQQQYLTQHWEAASNLNANASTFQPQVAQRVPPTPIKFIPGDEQLRASASPPRREKTPHLKVLTRPEPTAEYLRNANKSVETLEKPRQLLVILDLNGTLLFRKMRGGHSFVARPKVNEFIHYLLSNHRVMVWSSARPENVGPMCRKLFDEEQHAKFVAVWGRDTLRIPSSAYNSKVQVYKQLSWVWKDKHIQSINPDSTGVWDQSNTVLLDDSVEKAASEPHNLIRLEEFENRPDQQQSDVLGQVVKYLEMLKHERDVSAFMRVLPFTYQPGEDFDWKI